MTGGDELSGVAVPHAEQHLDRQLLERGERLARRAGSRRPSPSKRELVASRKSS